ncbi:MAG TPA: class I SAM-dependent methyltransferase [Anaerolineales bacterium]|nr:class I SAM-dependent methyltransferase [Anaerolineales bacterium]
MTDFVCPRCRGALDRESPDGFFCPSDRLTFERRRGIWRFLTPEAIARTAGFIREYETVRQAEGRGWPTSNDYRMLPQTDPADPLAGMWRIRAASFRCFEQRVLGRMTGKQRVADLGAGSGWLAYRIAIQGHSVDAVDLLDNDWDGLGAHRHYEDAFRPVQASFDELPYRPEVFNLVVFNAAFHYSVDYETTLEHTLAVLKPGGVIAVIDTPVYRREESGRRMVAEREHEFTGRFGFPSNALPLENFLTYERLEKLASSHDLAVRMHFPRASLRRRLEPLAARLRGRREPARFPVIVLATKQP